MDTGSCKENASNKRMGASVLQNRGSNMLG
jgi:hypothetical protein